MGLFGLSGRSAWPQALLSPKGPREQGTTCPPCTPGINAVFKKTEYELGKLALVHLMQSFPALGAWLLRLSRRRCRCNLTNASRKIYQINIVGSTAQKTRIHAYVIGP